MTDGQRTKVGELMLIRKKRGLGAGKINGPGGRIDPGETALQAAVRETEEEIGLTPRDLREAGQLSFQFVDGYGLESWSFTGSPRETDEAIPMWRPADRLPFDEMWADDELWIPEMLDGNVFRGYFVFDGDLMLSHRLEVDPPK